MISSIEKLLTRYENGGVSRRQLVAGLAALAATPAPAPGAPFAVATLNHVTLSVTDVERSREFYEKLFGIQVVSRQANGINLGAGPASFVGLYRIDGAPRLHHFCLGVERFEAKAALGAAQAQGVKAAIRDRDGVPELYLQDPDGITVQVQGKDYRG